MITLRKLQRLPEGTRLRKIARLLEGFQRDAARGVDLPMPYLGGLFEILNEYPWFETLPPNESPNAWVLGDVLHIVREHAGLEVADWDMDPGPEKGERSRVLPLTVYLDGVRSPFNVGSIIRTAEFFGFESVLLGPGSASADTARARRSAMGAERWLEVRAAAGPPPSPYFCLETGGKPLSDFPFPAAGTCVLGSEELGVRPEILDRAEGRVSLEGFGAKGSLNVGVAFGILAAAWSGKIGG